MNSKPRPRQASTKATSVLMNVVQSLVSGIILAFLFFVAREICFPLPSVAGRWTVEMHTTQTAYRPYEGMVVRYVAILWREGTTVKGTIEKTFEATSTDTATYIGADRTEGEIEGYIHKLYLSKDRIVLTIIEEGAVRESTHFHDLTVERADSMTGRFIATAADSEGEVIWRRN